MKVCIKNIFKALRTRLHGPFLITIIYFTFGFFWILLTDKILLVLSSDSSSYIKFQTYKGWLYIVITTILVYVLSRIYAIHKEKSLDLSRENERMTSENLKEKEILLKEIHHRVKNNLQIMISLLRLKGKYLNDSQYNKILKEITDKIHAIALVHEMLYKTDILSEVNFKAYILEITKYLLISLDVGKIVEIKTDLDDIILPVEVAVPCGILVNEIISNTFKFSYPDTKTGTMSIRLKNLDSTKFLLQIMDDKISFNASESADKDRSFGMHLIHVLADQLKSNLDISSDESGTTYSLTLNIH